MLFDSSFIIVVAGLYTFFAGYYFLIKSRSIKSKRGYNKQKFYETLTNALKKNTISSMDDLVNLYEGIMGFDKEDFNYKYRLTSLLQGFIVDLNNDKKIPSSERIAWINIVTKFISENEKESPFSDLPENERILFIDLNSFLNKKDYSNSQRKILELATFVQTREEEIQNVRRSNKWSVPLAIIGVFLTIVFGLISLLGK